MKKLRQLQLEIDGVYICDKCGKHLVIGESDIHCISDSIYCFECFQFEISYKKYLEEPDDS